VPFDLSDPLAGLAPEDAARLRAAGSLIGQAILAIVFSGGLGWQPILFGLLGNLSKLVKPGDVKWVAGELLRAGKLTWAQAAAIRAWLALNLPHTVADDPWTDLERGYGAAPAIIVGGDGTIPLDQTPIDPLAP
jgi:hypothetical protein